MNMEELKKDVAAAHAVFDLCKIPKTNRGTTPLPLRMRALILANAAKFQITQDDVDKYLNSQGRT